MGFFGRLFGNRKPKTNRIPGNPVVLENAMIDGATGQKAIVFSDIESMMQIAEAMEAAEQYAIGRPILYAFEHVILRDAAFENHPDLIRDLIGERSPIPLLYFQSKARTRCLQAGQISIESGEDDEAVEKQMDLFSAIAIHSHKRDGYSAYLISLPAPVAPPEAHFIAIVHRDAERHDYQNESPSTRYFTLEKTDISDHRLLCEWNRDATRKNHGAGPKPEESLFADAVFTKVLNQG